MLFGTNFQYILYKFSIIKIQNIDAGIAHSKGAIWDEFSEQHQYPTLFYHLPGVNLKKGFLNPHPLNLDCCVRVYPSINQIL